MDAHLKLQRRNILLVLTAVSLMGGLMLPGTVGSALAADSRQPPAGAGIMPPHTGRTNHLAGESSPYLLQHAGNPVDWYPWGPQAFEKARREDKPIFLSIGYSTCHWCHVMERESFADKDVAALLNQYFVSIKVDREERPDIDAVYMTVTQALTGSGGWPMTIIMTPDKKPFYAGTYFPKNTRWGRPGLMQLLPKIAALWQKERAKVLDSAGQITRHVAGLEQQRPAVALDRRILDSAAAALAERYDERFGGFGNAPKFPSAHQLMFLLRHHHDVQDNRALAMVENTLMQMRLGGIYDQIGFGFHRYSTDARWRVPHFEKMLYDQAMLVMVYTEAFQVTGKAFYARVAAEIITYVLRELTSPGGGFFSAEDADSQGIEGRFYLWRPEQIQRVLDPAEAALVLKIFNVKKGGNFEDAGPGQHVDENILYLQKPLAQLVSEMGIAEKQLRQRLEAARQKMLSALQNRVHPFKDDKILTDWNGLMIAALARAGRVFKKPRYTAAAQKAADFVLHNLVDDRGRLLKRYRAGKAGLPAHLNDYAFMVWGLLELYRATFQTKYLAQAVALNGKMLSHFWDASNGGLYLTADDSEKLLLRSKQIYDGAIPSANSVALLNLLRLGRLTGKTMYMDRAERMIKAFSGVVSQFPAGHCQFMTALAFALNPGYEVVIVGEAQKEDTRQLLAALQRRFLPQTVVLLRPADSAAAAGIVDIAPFARTMTAKSRRATAYVCRQFACRLPTTDVKQMLKNLGKAP